MYGARSPLLILFVRSLSLDWLGRRDASDSGHGDLGGVVVGLLQQSRTKFPALLNDGDPVNGFLRGVNEKSYESGKRRVQEAARYENSPAADKRGSCG